ncbi:hypothetical protein NSERUTF1_3549 [Nocardia seriolae]|nr:hypothetical protein NSERUTF1_3549 [Nocardia seriolae]
MVACPGQQARHPHDGNRVACQASVVRHEESSRRCAKASKVCNGDAVAVAGAPVRRRPWWR